MGEVLGVIRVHFDRFGLVCAFGKVGIVEMTLGVGIVFCFGGDLLLFLGLLLNSF